jgi:hypothetical protein
LVSQSIFGVRSNEVVGANGKAYFFDMTAEISQAEKILNAIVIDKAYPRKVFTINTDWSYLNLEPGDVVNVQPATLNDTVEARITEIRTDERLFSQITAKEIDRDAAPPYVGQAVSVYTPTGTPSEYWLNTYQVNHGIGNQFTFFGRFKYTEDPGSSYFSILSMLGGVDNNSSISIQNKQFAGDEHLRVILNDQGGATAGAKLWVWEDFFLDFNRWYQMFVTWDGTDIRVYHAEVGSSLSEIAVDTKTDDDPISRIDSPLSTLISGLKGCHQHEMAMWNTVLSEAAMNSLIVGGANEYGLKGNRGAHTYASNLRHWWRLGLSSSRTGKDYANAGFNVDVGVHSKGIDSSDIITSYPGE